MEKRMLSIVVMAATLLCFGSEANAQETIKLFNGKDLSNWNFIISKNSIPADQVYYVKNGVINITGQPFGYMYTKEKYGDYKLHLEYRWPNGQEKANSGIFLLIEDPKNPLPKGIECNLMFGNAGDFVLHGGADLAEYQNKAGESRPTFPVIRKSNGNNEKPVGEWNEVDVFVKEGIITVYINGIYQNKGTNKVKKGHIGLQSEGKEVQFRNIAFTPS